MSKDEIKKRIIKFAINVKVDNPKELFASLSNFLNELLSDYPEQIVEEAINELESNTQIKKLLKMRGHWK